MFPFMADLKVFTTLDNSGEYHLKTEKAEHELDMLSILFDTTLGELSMTIQHVDGPDEGLYIRTGIDVNQAEALHAYLGILLRNERTV
jgi:hypothetical protein